MNYNTDGKVCNSKDGHTSEIERLMSDNILERSANLDSSTNSTLATNFDGSKSYVLDFSEARRKSCGTTDISKYCGTDFKHDTRISG